MTRLPLASLALVGLITSAAAQTYPDRTITMIVPFAAGGASDVIARIVGERMGQALGKTIINENVAGAGGVIALNRVAAAKPDGYTILIGNTGTNAASYVLTPDVKFTPESFAPVGLIAKTAPVLAVKKDFPAQTLAEFVSYLKANPGKVNLAHAGVTKGVSRSYQHALFANHPRLEFPEEVGIGRPKAGVLLGGGREDHHLTAVVCRPALPNWEKPMVVLSPADRTV
ncbi:MAG: tripartite tricarboxylate transporter receptor family protein [Hyphomicrobiales bacterium]|nr:tripartite tricarboxylate transporter receptor family protein [Hyphomicrobiales bacterium]